MSLRDAKKQNSEVGEHWDHLLGDNLSNIEARFEEVTNKKDMMQLLRDIDHEMIALEKNMWKYSTLELKKKQNEISNIEFNRTKLSSAISASGQLTTLYSNANDLGHSLTYKIKSLDNEILNVSKTFEFVENVHLLKNNINQASYAIDRKDWQLAAKCIHTIKTKLPSDLVNGRFASVVVPSTDIPDLPEVAVDKWVEQLTDVFKQKFDEASSRKDLAELTKYFELFPLIQQEEVGLNCYSKFIRQIISETLRLLISSLSKSGVSRPGIYSDISMQLFESISVMLSQHEPFIQKNYSSTFDNAMYYVVTKVEYEVDSQIGLIGDTFYDTKKIEEMINYIKSTKGSQIDEQREYYNGSSENNTEVPEQVSIIEVGDIIGELSSILHNWMLYCRFIASKYCHVAGNEANGALEFPDLIKESNFFEKRSQKYLPAFDTLVDYYLLNSLKKAISIEELPSIEDYLTLSHVSSSPEVPPASSVIEDTTLVLNTVFTNVINTGDIFTIKIQIEHIFNIINHELINAFFAQSITQNLPRYNSGLYLVTQASESTSAGYASPGISRSATPVPDSTTGTMGFLKGASSALGTVVGGTGFIGSSNITSLPPGSQNTKMLNFILYLNTIAIGQEYFKKLIEAFEKNDLEYLKTLVPFNKDYEKVSGALHASFLDPFNTSTDKIIQESLLSLYNQCIKNKLVTLINDLFPEYDDSNYLIYSSDALDDTASSTKFSNSWQSMMRPYRQTLHKSLVFTKFLRLVIINLANLMERKIWSILKNFKLNELGSLKLEKDMSNFINEICEDNYGLRDRFIRVTQIVLLLGMDDDEYDMSIETKELGEESDDSLGINWVLTPSERQQARASRV